MKPDQFAQILDFGRETTGVEFKSPGMRTDKSLLSQVIKAMIGMANKRDGGSVIIGVAENDELDPIGLTEDQLASWEYSTLADIVATYVEPSIEFTVKPFEFENKYFIEIRINEFESCPIISKKDYGKINSGRCYIRSSRKPATTSDYSYYDLRELIDLAVEKGVRKFLTRASNAGINIDSLGANTQAELFQNEIDEFERSSELIDKIKKRGYWKTIIRPVIHNETKIEIKRLVDIVKSARVSNTKTGRDYPFADIYPGSLSYDRRFVSYELDSLIKCKWAAFQSGLFICYSGFRIDWLDDLIQPTVKDWEPNKYLGVIDTLLSAIEIFTFLSNLFFTDILEDSAYTEISMNNLKNRSLLMDSSRRLMRGKYTSDMEIYSENLTLTINDVTTSHKEMAIKFVYNVFYRMGWDVDAKMLNSFIEDI